MTPDLRAANVRFAPPLPGWLKYLYLGSAIGAAVIFLGFGFSLRSYRQCRTDVQMQALQIEQARATIMRVDQALGGQQAARVLQ
ncbi:MAG: hypothetical protein PHE83_17175, partial [Opitutaceae bacterium]|nr:hypothetical protein [Opitutaceae bacterium]